MDFRCVIISNSMRPDAIDFSILTLNMHWRIWGGVSGARPLLDPILSFSHTFSPKSARVRGPCPLMGACPPTGNPGSTTDMHRISTHPAIKQNKMCTRMPRSSYLFQGQIQDLVKGGGPNFFG